MPPDLADWLPADHEARFIKEIVERLDLEEFYREYDQPEGRGRPPYHPAMMLSLLLYGYCTGVFSSRKIERATYESIPFRFLSANQQPDHDSIATFRRRHLKHLKDVFLQVVLIAREMGLVKLGNVAIDGTKIRANAAKRSTVEVAKLRHLMKKQKKKIKELFKQAERADVKDEAEQSRLDRELADAEKRQEKLEQAFAQVEELTRQYETEVSARESEIETSYQEKKVDAEQQRRLAGSRLRQQRLAKGLTQQELANLVGLRRARIAQIETGSRAPKPQERASLEELVGIELPIFAARPRRSGSKKPGWSLPKRINLTDGDSTLMKLRNTGGSIQAYNAQLAVDSTAQIIVATGLTSFTHDRHSFIPMANEIKRNMGEMPTNTSADTGYCSIANLEAAISAETNLLIPPERTPKRYTNPHPAVQSMRRKLARNDQRLIYNQRSAIVEPPIGRIKTGLGFRKFLLRGKDQVLGEWNLIATAHNILKLFAHRGLS